jgi:hypothetical protein
MKEPIELLTEEVQRQIDRYAYTDEYIMNNPDNYGAGELAIAAAAYCCTDTWLTKDNGYIPDIIFPWSDEYFKPNPDDRIRELVKAGAMIIREIKRQQTILIKSGKTV